MKYAKKKNNSRLIWVVCLLSVLLIALIGLAVLLQNGEQPGKAGDASTEAPGQTTAPVEGMEMDPARNPELIELETPYCAMYFPTLWEDILHINPVEGDGYRMEFGCRFEDGVVHRIFDISFVTPNGTALGAVTGPDGEPVQVYIQFYEPDEDLEGDMLTTFQAIQEDANQLIALLPLVDSGIDSGIDSGMDSGDKEDVLIQTPFCQLIYPGQWEQYLSIEHREEEEYIVDFYAQLSDTVRVHLFSVKFGTDTETALMVLTDSEGNAVGVNVEMMEISQDDLSQEQLDVVYSMQESVNNLLDALAQSSRE